MKYTLVKTETIDEIRKLVDEIDDICNQPYSDEGTDKLCNNEHRIKLIIRDLVGRPY